MVLLLTFFAVSIVFSFLCSLWEATLLTIPPSYVETLSQKGTDTGRLLKAYKTDVDRPLSAILTLNTIAHTVGAIGVGAQATRVWPGNELMTGAVVPVVMTLAILILSEIIPKTYGATRWKSLIGFTVSSLRIIQIALAPLVWLSELITRGLKGDKDAVTVSRTDMVALAALSQREGVLDEGEGKLMHNLLHLRDVTAYDIMTPRTVMHAARQSETIAGYIAANAALPYSRIPLVGATRDEIEGYVLKDDILLEAFRQNGSRALADLSRPLLVVAEEEGITQVLDRLVASREHIARVVDEFGGTAGLITQEDIFETLLGLEIVDESDRTTDLQALARELNQTRLAERKRELAADSAQARPSTGGRAARQASTPAPDSPPSSVDAIDGATPTLGLTGQQVPIDDSGDERIAR